MADDTEEEEAWFEFEGRKYPILQVYNIGDPLNPKAQFISTAGEKVFLCTRCNGNILEGLRRCDPFDCLSCGVRFHDFSCNGNTWNCGMEAIAVDPNYKHH